MRTLTYAQAVEMLTYAPTTGTLRWRVDRSNRVRAGSIAGSVDAHGYRRVRVNGRNYRATHLIWLLVTGVTPPAIIEHRNRARDDNRWCNLRLATQSQNNANVVAHRRNKLGVKGVFEANDRQRRKRFVAAICVNGIRKRLGRFSSVAEAKAIYDAEARRLFGEFART